MTKHEHDEASVDRLLERLRRDLAGGHAQEHDQEDLERLAQLLAADLGSGGEAPPLWTTLSALRPEMNRRASLQLSRRALRLVLLALLPLPVVILYASYVLRAIYTPIATLLSPDVAGYVAAVHVMLLTLLFGATYAAIPVLLARGERGPGAAAALSIGGSMRGVLR